MSTSRLALAQILDAAAVGPEALREAINDHAAKLDVAGIFGSGTLTARPPAGIADRFYYVTGDSTAVNNGILWRDSGTAWAQVGAPAATVAGTVVRRVLVPDLSAVASYTFSGLDGDTDRQYRLGLSGVFAISAVDRAISIRPAPSGASGSTANFFDSVYRQDWWDTGGMQTLEGEYRGDGVGLLLALGNSWSTYGANHVTAEALVEARRKTGTPRTHKASWSSSPDAVTERQLVGHAGGNWENNANNITSLMVHFGGGTFTGDLWLERVFA